MTLATDRRLLPPAWWPLAGFAWVCSVLVLGWLAWQLHRTGSGGRIDLALDGRLADRLSTHGRLLDALSQLGSPQFVVAASALLALLATSLHWWRGVAFSLLGAPLAGAVTHVLLKPFVSSHAPDGRSLAFPSGHTTGAFGVALVLTVLLLPRAGSPTVLRTALRLLLGLVALSLAAGTAISVVALGFHRTTDAVGGFATAILVVLAVAGVLDLAAGRRARP